MAVVARYYPPSGASIAQAVTLARASDGALRLTREVDGLPQHFSYPLDSLDISERFCGGNRRIALPDGGVIETAESPALQQLLQSLGYRDGLVTQWQQSWHAVALAVLAGIAACVLGYLYALPWAADRVARTVPDSWARQLDRVVLSQLQRGEDFTDSQLSKARQQALRTQFMAVAERQQSRLRDPIEPDIRFLRHGTLANAFALPGGTIIFLDGLVELAPDDAALLGVFAHEWAHVQHRHGLRTLARTTALSLLAAWYLGDVSALANAAVVFSQLQYSRQFETEADDVALAILRAENIDSRPMAELFRRLQAKSDFSQPSAESGDDHQKEPDAEKGAKPRSRLPEFLSTHPDIEQRIERFERDAEAQTHTRESK